jgi:hypothetical protein
MKRKKTWLLDQSLIDRVRRIYKSKTETEAVTKALQNALFQEDVAKAVRATAGRIPRIEKVF